MKEFMKDEQVKVYRKEYKRALDTVKYWKNARKKEPRKFTKEYYFASGAEWALAEMAQVLGIELLDENLKLIEE